VDHKPQRRGLNRHAGDGLSDIVKGMAVGWPSSVKVSLATDNMSTDACLTHTWFDSFRQPRRRAKSFGFSLVARMKRHGCSLLDEAAQRAASNRLPSFSGST
jgi:hypothetical protein